MSLDPNEEFRALLQKRRDDSSTAERIRELAILGADLTILDPGGVNWTAAHLFAQANMPQSLHAVLDCGVDVFAQDRYGWTALEYVLKHNTFEQAAQICFDVMAQVTDRDWTRVFDAVVKPFSHEHVIEPQDFLFARMGECIGWAFHADAFEDAQDMVYRAAGIMYRCDPQLIEPLIKSWRNWADSEALRTFFNAQLSKPQLHIDPDKPDPLNAKFLLSHAGIGNRQTLARHPRPVIDMGEKPGGGRYLDFPAA